MLLDGLCVRRSFGQEGERLGRKIRDGHRRGLSEGVEVGYRGYALVLPHGRIDYQ